MKILSITRKFCMGVAAMPLVLAYLASHSLANTITANSASYNDVSNAVASASPGDTVIIPPGTAAWTETLFLSGVSLQGSGSNATVIIDEENHSGGSPEVMILDAVTNALTEVSDLQLQGALDNKTVNYDGAIACYGSTNTSWRVTGCVFTNLYAKNIDAYGNALCVIDHNAFYMGVIAIEDNSAFPADGFGMLSWAMPPTYGTGSSNCLYVEDNYFTNIVGYVASVGACDGEGGARIVFRYNTVWNDLFNNHGTESGGTTRSERSFEIYNNSFNFSPNAPDYPGIGIAFIRGGSGVIYSNTSTGYASLVDLRYYRYMTDYSGQWDPYDGANGTNNWDSNSPTEFASGTSDAGPGVSYLDDPTAHWSTNQWVGYMLNNTSDGTFAPITGNTGNTIYYMDESWISSTLMTFNIGDTYAVYLEYAALDQPGRGSGDLLAVVPPYTNANVIDTVTGTVSWPREALDSIYCWSNTIAGTNAGMVSYYPTLQEGRDFYNDTPKPGYTPYVYPHPLDTNGSVPPPSGLVAWWKFDEGSGTIAHDSSGNGNDGTLGGSSPPQWVDGALSFNGSGYVTCGTNNVPLTFPLTISYWVNFSSGGGGTVLDRMIFSNEVNWHCADSSAWLPTGNGYFDDVTFGWETNIDDGNWHLVTVTDSPNGDGTATATIYLDSVNMGSGNAGTTGATLTGTPTISMGIESDFLSNAFNGMIDDVRIYTNVLSNTDIATLYSTGRQ